MKKNDNGEESMKDLQCMRMMEFHGGNKTRVKTMKIGERGLKD